MIEPMFTNNYDDTYTVQAMCCSCSGITTDLIGAPDLFRYRRGTHAQDAFPYLTASAREALFVSGLCGACWDAMFGEED